MPSSPAFLKSNFQTVAGGLFGMDGPERYIQTGIGAVEVRRPKVRDRAVDASDGAKLRFTSTILPKGAGGGIEQNKNR